MISPPERARPRRAGESYEEKCERRQETREALRRRGHAHSARRPGRSEEQPQSPRQREFLRRRNLGSTAGELSAPVLLQVMLQPPPRRGPDLTGTWSLRSAERCNAQHPPCSCCCLQLISKHLNAVAHLLFVCELKQPHGLKHFPFPAGNRAALWLPEGRHQAPRAALEQEQPCIIIIIRPRAASPQEALHRELLLKQKMVILQELLATLLHASEKSWQGQLNEDKLKCKLRALENQLQACTQSYSKECVKKILIEMEDQKQTYEQKAKEALQKMLEDKLQAEQQLQNSQVRSTFDTWLCINLIQPLDFRERQQPVCHLQRCKITFLNAPTQSPKLCQALDFLQHEHAELQQHADTLQQDNQLQAKHICNIEGTTPSGKGREQGHNLKALVLRVHPKQSLSGCIA
uniref:TRAF3 interacting protein 3 n=1 Tax=Phasianus colchicus TaxID=9054 RepID=A0A669QM10_PHACC